MSRIRFHLVLLLFFLLLTLILTYPLVTRITTHVPGSELWAFDEYTFVWNIWWFKYTLLNLNQSPLASNFIFYPVGVNFALYTMTMLNAALALPLVPFLPLPLLSNLITILAFVMSAYGAYLLMKFLLLDVRFQIDRFNQGSRIENQKTEMAAIAAGIAYAFTTSKFVYAAIGHYNLVGTEWIPFCVLYFLRTLKRGALRDTLLAGLFLALAMYVEMQIGVLLAFFMLLGLLVSRRWRHISWPRLLTQLSLMGVVVALLYLPVLLPVLNELLFADYTLKGWGDAQKLSADLLGFVSPSALSSWAGLNWNQELTNVVQGKSRFSDVNTLFVGYATLALALAGAAAYRRKVSLWVIGALTFALFALGPLLQINGVSTFDLEGVKLNFPLPFIILHYIPIVQANRVPNRFSVVLMLCIAMLVGFGAHWLAGRFGAIAGRVGTRILFPVAAMISLLLIADHLSIPLPLTDARVPEFYSQLANDSADYAILELPLGWRNSFGTLGAEDTRVQYYQSVHHKRLLGGNTSRNHPFKFDYFASLPIVSSLIAIEDYQTVPPDVRAFDKTYADEFVRFFDLRFVVVHPPVAGRHPYDDTRAAALQYVLDVLPLDPVSASEDLLVYRVRRTPMPDDLIMDFGEPAARAYHGMGWDREEEISGARANWATAMRAQVYVPIETVSDFQLSFSALPFTYADAPTQIVTVVANDRVRLAPIKLSEGWNTYEMRVPASALQRGLNVLTFEFAYARAPREVMGSDDARPLSVAVDWMRWTRK